MSRRSAPDDRRTANFLGGDYLNVYRQPCAVGAEPADDSVYRESFDDTAQLSDTVYSVFHLMGSYIGQNNATELLLLVGMGVCATILRFADYPLAPLLIGFILGRMLEDNFARSMQLYDGIGFILDRPMTLGLLVIATLLVVIPSYRSPP